MATI
jgi:hypothetical protein